LYSVLDKKAVIAIAITATKAHQTQYLAHRLAEIGNNSKINQTTSIE
jgi:hypothetical protein